MPDYRLYPLTGDGRFAPPADFFAASDDVALVHADGLDCPHGYELWEGPRFIARVDRARSGGHANAPEPAPGP